MFYEKFIKSYDFRCVPQKGGDPEVRYVYTGPPAPPPVDYTPAWNRATANINRTSARLTEFAMAQARIGVRGEDPRTQTINLNTELDKELETLDASIADVNNIPDGDMSRTAPGGAADKRKILESLRTTRNNVNSYKTTVPPEVIPPPEPVPIAKTRSQILGEEIARQNIALQQISRVMGRPIEPARPETIWPTTSWQYELWNKGYSIREISWAEQHAAENDLQRKTEGDFGLFKLQIEDIIQDSIIDGSLARRFAQEVNDVRITTSVANGSTNNLTSSSDNMNIPVYVNMIGSTETNPRLIPASIRRNRRFAPGIVQTSMLPQTNTITTSTNVVPSQNNWESRFIGAGGTVAELDTTRRMMATSRFTPGVDMGTVALQMLSNLRAQNANQETAPPMTAVPAVTSSMSRAAIARSNAIARRESSLARRGAGII